MKYFIILLFTGCYFWIQAQEIKVILMGDTKSYTGEILHGATLYLVQNDITVGTASSDYTGEFIVSAFVSKGSPFVLKCAKPGFVSKNLLFDLKNLAVSKRATNYLVRLTDTMTLQLMKTNPLVSFSIGERNYAEKFRWDETLSSCVTDLEYKEKYRDSLNKRIKDEEGKMLIAAFKSKSFEFEQVKNYGLAIQYLDSAAKKATSYNLMDSTIDRKKTILQTAWAAQQKEMARVREIDSLYSIGDSLLALLKWKDALSKYDAILKKDPTSAKVQGKIAACKAMEAEIKERDKEINQYATHRKTCTQQANGKKYKEAIVTIQKSNALTRIPQVLKNSIQGTVDSLNILLNEQNLENELKKETDLLKKLMVKSDVPTLKSAFEKVFGVISNFKDPKKQADANATIDKLLNTAIEAEFKKAYLLHSNGKTEYDKAISEYDKIKILIVLLSDATLKANLITMADTRIADANKNKMDDAQRYASALKFVKDNLDSATFYSKMNPGFTFRLNTVKKALTSEPLKSKLSQPEVAALSSRNQKVSDYFNEMKKELPKLSGKDSLVALASANAFVIKAGTNEVGALELAFLQFKIDSLKSRMKFPAPSTAQSVRGTVIPAPQGAKIVSSGTDVSAEMELTLTMNKERVTQAWDNLKNELDVTNTETAKSHSAQRDNQMSFDEKQNDTRDQILAHETESHYLRTEDQVKATDQVNVEIAHRNLDSKEMAIQRAERGVGLQDTLDIKNKATASQNEKARDANSAYIDEVKDIKDENELKEKERLNLRVEDQQALNSATEVAKANQDLAALEYTHQAKEKLDKIADYIDTTRHLPNYLKKEDGSCFPWNAMTQLTYKTENESGFTSSVIIRRVVVDKYGYGVVYEQTINDQGVHSYSLNGQAIPESFWNDHSSGESVISEGGSTTPNNCN